MTIMTDALNTQTHGRSKAENWVWLAMILPFLGALVYFVVLTGTPFAMVFYSLVKLFTLFFPVVAHVLIEKRPMSLPNREGVIRAGKSIPLGLVTGLGLSMAMLGLFVWTPLGDVVLQHSGSIRSKVAGLGVLGYYVPFVCFLSFAHSLLEEYYWRWYVFGRLDRMGWGKQAHLLAALAFSLHHYVVLAGFFGLPLGIAFGSLVGVGGAIWSWQFKRTGSLIGSWISHIIVDAVIMTVGYFILFN